MSKLKSTCAQCATDFFYDTRDRTGKFCSRKCYEKSRNKPETRECSYCKKSFSFHGAYRVKDICCSVSCGQKYRRTKDKEIWNNKDQEEKLVIFRERFEDHVIKKDGCWDWNSSISHGYGSLKINGKQYLAHRVSWMIHKGLIPDGMFVLHKCLKSRKCTNPEHLYIGTALENNHDIIRSGDRKKFLTKEQVMEIRKLINLGVPCSKIAISFKIGRGAIMDIKKNKTWRHL